MKLSKKLTTFAVLLTSLMSACTWNYKPDLSFDEFLKRYPDPYVAMDKIMYEVKSYPFFQHTIYFTENSINKFEKSAEHGYFFDLQSVEDLVIDGQGSTISIDAFNSFIRIVDSKKITIKNFNLTYHRLGFTQGKVIDVNPAKGCFSFRVDEGYPHLPSDKWSKEIYGDDVWQYGAFMSYNTKTRRHDFAERVHVRRVEALAVEGEYNIYLSDVMSAEDAKFIRVGEPFAMRAPIERNLRLESRNEDDYKRLMIVPKVDLRYVSKKLASVMIDNSSDVSFENVTLSRSRLNGVIATNNSGGVKFHNFNIRYGEPKDIVSTFVNGMYFANNKHGPTIEECVIEGVLEDAIVLTSRAAMITYIVSDHHYEITESAIKADTKIGVYYPNSGHFFEHIDVVGRDGDIIETNKPIPDVILGSMVPVRNAKSTQIFNMDYINSGYRIAKCKFYGNAGYAILTRAYDGHITENEIYATDAGIAVMNDTVNLYAGPIPRNVLIENNKVFDANNNQVITQKAVKLGDGVENVIVK